MYRISSISLFFFLILFACNNISESDNFKKDNCGLKYRIISESESKIPIKIGDYIELDLNYKNASDSILFNSKEFSGSFKMQVEKISHSGGSFENALMLMNPGDHYQFLLPADSFYRMTKHERLPKGVQSGSNLLFDIKIIRKVPNNEIVEERELLEKQMKEQEDILIQQFVTDNEINTEAKESGLFFIEQVKGRGKKARPGDTLIVHYNSKLIDGKLFDSSYKRNEPFVFVLGNGDAIQGLEEAFSYMKKGSKAMLIIPSNLAYGSRGYSTIIPPFAPLVFEVELVDIK